MNTRVTKPFLLKILIYIIAMKTNKTLVVNNIFPYLKIKYQKEN